MELKPSKNRDITITIYNDINQMAGGCWNMFSVLPG
jgi:hypothetical protein